MIGKLKGLIDSYGEDYVILDVGGVGYQVVAFGGAPSPKVRVLSCGRTADSFICLGGTSCWSFRVSMPRAGPVGNPTFTFRKKHCNTDQVAQFAVDFARIWAPIGNAVCDKD
jgi:hypothetical protein